MTEIIGNILLPSHIAAILLTIGIGSAAVPRLRYFAKYPLMAGAMMILVFSNGLVAAMLIGPLDYRYPATVMLDESMSIDTVVVLTAYATDDHSIPLSSRPGSSALYRVIETSRLYREGKLRRIIVSGTSPAARIMTELLKSIGIPPDVIEHDSGAMHTSESSVRLKTRLADHEFFLVTSAGHMPRAMGVFRAAGLNPVPVPTDHQMPKNWKSASLMPRPYHLMVSDLAIHEYGGLLWYWLSGKTEKFW